MVRTLGFLTGAAVVVGLCWEGISEGIETVAAGVSAAEEATGRIDPQDAAARGYTEVQPGVWMDCTASGLDVVPEMRTQAEAAGADLAELEEVFAGLGGECPSEHSLKAFSETLGLDAYEGQGPQNMAELAEVTGLAEYVDDPDLG